MRRLGARDILAILFIIAGAIPIVVWLGSWLYRSATREQMVQAVVVVIVLYSAWWIRNRFEKK